MVITIKEVHREQFLSIIEQSYSVLEIFLVFLRSRDCVPPKVYCNLINSPLMPTNVVNIQSAKRKSEPEELR